VNTDADQGAVPARARSGRPVRRPLDPAASTAAARSHWDADAAAYLAEHRTNLGDCSLLWGPEGLRESEAGLLGDLRGLDVLELGCGAAQGARWAIGEGARAVGLDLSLGMLRAAAAVDADQGTHVPTVAGDAERLPLRDQSFDAAFSAFGALPFVADAGAALRELHRVLRPGGAIACSVLHPFRWVFPDDPSASSLTVRQSYFDRRPYVELSPQGRPQYAEHHRTVADWTQAWIGTGLVLDALIEPEWVPGAPTWGAWSAERGALIPGTLILLGHRPKVTVG
jgi:SAM-dependent methyltransferase